MADFAREVGTLSGCFEYAEGWRRRSHLGYSEQDTDPLSEALGEKVVTDSEYEKALLEARW